MLGWISARQRNSLAAVLVFRAPKRARRVPQRAEARASDHAVFVTGALASVAPAVVGISSGAEPKPAIRQTKSVKRSGGDS